MRSEVGVWEEAELLVDAAVVCAVYFVYMYVYKFIDAYEREFYFCKFA